MLSKLAHLVAVVIFALLWFKIVDHSQATWTYAGFAFGWLGLFLSGLGPAMTWGSRE